MNSFESMRNQELQNSSYLETCTETIFIFKKNDACLIIERSVFIKQLIQRHLEKET